MVTDSLTQRFGTMQLPDAPDATAPDGSDVPGAAAARPWLDGALRLAAGRVSRAVARHAVEELWYILAGQGQMWRRQGERQEKVPLRPGTCLSIPPAPTSSSGPPTAVRWRPWA